MVKGVLSVHQAGVGPEEGAGEGAEEVEVEVVDQVCFYADQTMHSFIQQYAPAKSPPCCIPVSILPRNYMLQAMTHVSSRFTS